jgi:hypothetical protein
LLTGFAEDDAIDFKANEGHRTTLYTHVPHPHIAARKVSGPARTVDQLDRSPP